MRPVQVLKKNPNGHVGAPIDPPIDPPVDPVENDWATMKVIVGGIDRKGIPALTKVKSLSTGQLMSIDPSPSGENLIRGCVYTGRWNAYEPTLGNFALTANGTSFMDTAQAKGLGVRARPELGLNAPTNAKTLFGAALQMYEHGVSTQGDITPFTVGHLWEQLYWNRADQLFAFLASVLPNWSVFKELSLSHTMSFFEEPMIWQLAFKGVRNETDTGWLYKPNTMLMWETFVNDPETGYTYNKQLASYERTIDRARTLLPGTHAKNFVFNTPMQFVTNANPANAETAKMGTNEAPVMALVDRAAKTDQIVLMNHSLRLWPINSSYDRMYKRFVASGAPAAYQTINNVNKWWNENPDATMFKIAQKAVEEYGAFSLEYAGISPTYLSQERSGSIAQAAGQSRMSYNYEQLVWLNEKMENNYNAFLVSKAV